MAGQARLNHEVLKKILVPYVNSLENGFFLIDVVDVITPIYHKMAGDSTRKSALNDLNNPLVE